MKKPKPTRVFLSSMFLQAKQQGDAHADAWVKSYLNEKSSNDLRSVFAWLSSQDLRWDEQEEVVQRFFRASAQLPTWADTKQIDRGLAFAAQHQSSIALMLGCLSLPYCYAGADGAKVLWYSARIKHDTRKRLEETGDFVFGVLQTQAWHSTSAMSQAMVRILKIRLIHAIIRHYTLQHQPWDTEAWGYPVNQTDMAGTNLAFSYMVLMGMRKNGHSIADADAEAYLHLWRVIGALLGVSEDWLPTNSREAYLIGSHIAKVQFRASPEGTALTKALLQTLTEVIEPAWMKPVVEAFMRFLLGDEIANLLGLSALRLETRLVPLLPVEKIWQRTFENTVKVIA